MTQQMPGAAVPHAGQPPQRQAAPPDPIAQTIMDLQRDRQRLAKMTDPTSTKLALEINDTVLSYQDETLRHLHNVLGEVLRLRGWLDQVVPDLGQRVVDLEEDQDDQDGGLDDETLAMVLKIVQACREMATMAISSVPNDGTKEAKAAKAQLTDVLAMCEAVWERLGEDEEADEAEEEDAVAPAPPGNGAAS